jgi:CDP-diacylglycerol--glycerol-3-phosphate 3-phosphatidyltransferase
MLDLPDSKPWLQRLLRPAALSLGRRGVHPNTLTLTSLGGSTLAGALALAFPTAVWPLLAILAAMALRLALNHIDGMLARERGLQTPWGGLLNEMATPAEDIALYLPLAARPGMPSALIVSAVMLSVLVEVAGLSALALGGTRRVDGPMTKFARGAFFGALALAAALGLAPAPWVAVALVLVLGLLAVTAGNRLSRAVTEVSP